MISLIALLISVGLQIVAASIALRFMKLTKYRVSWILLSLAFTFMAARKIIQLIEMTRGETSLKLQMVDAWIGTLISVFIFAGVILIRELFLFLKKAETDRLRSEKRVLHAIINTEEAERKRFAKDLHDDLGPLLSTVKMSISALNNRITEPTDREILENTNLMVNEAIGTIKNISNTLSPHILSNFGLVSATNSFISKINQAGSFIVSFDSNLGNVRLNPDVEVVLYRSICELTNNSIKHSGASNIEIELNIHGKFLILQYSDNGRGFDFHIREPDEEMGMGISNIQTRVKSIDGVLFIDSSPGSGMQAIIRLIMDNDKYLHNNE